MIHILCHQCQCLVKGDGYISKCTVTAILESII